MLTANPLPLIVIEECLRGEPVLQLRGRARLDRCARRARREAADGVQKILIGTRQDRRRAAHVRLLAERQPDAGRIGANRVAEEFRGRDAGERHRLAADEKRRPDNGGVAPEAPIPRRVAQDEHRLGAGRSSLESSSRPAAGRTPNVVK